MKKQKSKNVEIEPLKTENVPLVLIYKNGKSMNIEITKDASMFEVYGFLSCFVKELEYDLSDMINKK